MNRNSIIGLVLVLALGAGLWFLLSSPSEEGAPAGEADAAAEANPGAGSLTGPGQDPAAAAGLSRTDSPAAGELNGAAPALDGSGAEVILLARDASDRPIRDAWATAVEDLAPDMPAGMRMGFGEGRSGTAAPARLTADAQGRIRIPVPVGQRLVLEVASPAHQSKYLSLQALANGESLDLGPVALMAGAQVKGRVLDPDGKAVAGARVALRAADRGNRGFTFGGGRNADSGADGSFAFTGVEPGNYVLEAEARGFAPARGETGARVTAKAGPAAADAVLRLQAGRVLNGMVVDPDRRPIAGAEVFLRSPMRGGGISIALPGSVNTRAPDAVTDSAGRFSLRGVEAGNGSRVSARASGYGLGWASGDANAAELLIQLAPALSFGGTVLSPDGKPVAGIEVRLERVEDEEEGFNFRSLFDDHAATTDAGGRFLIDGLDPGVWAILARTDSASSSGQRVDLAQDVLDHVVRLAPASVLTVGVTRDLDGAPIEDALVVLTSAPEPEQQHGGPGGPRGREIRVRAGGPGGPQVSFGDDDQRLRTGPDGIAAFADLPQGRYDLRVEADGYAHDSQILVRERGSQRVEMGLLPGADLRVTVEDGAGLPLPGVEVLAKPADPALAGKADNQTRRTDDSGRAIFAGLAPGAWTVDYRAAASVGGFAFAGPNSSTTPTDAKSHTEVPVMLVPGDAAEVVLQASGLCIPTVSITRRGAVLAGAEVRLEAVAADDGGFRMPSFGGGTRTDANGRARLQPSEPGEYELVVTPGSGLPERREKVTLTAGPQELEFDVRGGRISGLVLADGRTPANATARLEPAPAEGGGNSRQPRGRFLAITANDDGNGPSGAVSFGGPAATSAQVDGSGRFSFEEVPPGEYVVRVSATGFAGWTSERIVLTENQEREIGTATLVSGGVIRGVNRRMSAADAESGFGGIMLLMDANGEQAGFAQAGADGAFEFKDLATGAYTIIAPPGYNSEPIEVKAGQTVTFDVPAN
jgi:hypothetical protein